MSNIEEDERVEGEVERIKFDLLLKFIDGEGFDRYKAIREGRSVAPGPEVHGEINKGPAESEFLNKVVDLPSRRINKPEAVDEYVAKKMGEIADKHPDLIEGLEPKVVPKQPGEKQFVYERKVVYKRKENG